MPSDRQCVWVRPSLRALAALEAASQLSGCSKSAIVAFMLEQCVDVLDRMAVEALERGRRVPVEGGFQVAVSSTTATNSPR